MSTLLTVTIDNRHDGAPVIKAAGEIDMTSAATLAGALDDNPGPVVVDLADVEYLDSAGLNLLFAQADRIEEVIANPLIGRVITISGLSALTKVSGLTATDS